MISSPRARTRYLWYLGNVRTPFRDEYQYTALLVVYYSCHLLLRDQTVDVVNPTSLCTRTDHIEYIDLVYS